MIPQPPFPTHSPKPSFSVDLQSTAADMVVTLGPGKFYGSSLPRPRFYTDIKFSDERVDPPTSVMGPLMAWAEEARWSMGGLNVKRHRLQGRIEGNVDKLRKQRDSIFNQSPIPHKSDKRNNRDRLTQTPSPPPAPATLKRRRVVRLVDKDEEEVVVKKGPVRKLGDDFERVARECGMAVTEDAMRSKTDKADAGVDEAKNKKGKKRLRKIGAGVVAAAGIRNSPRLSKFR